MDELLKAYEEKYGESFPLMICRGMSDETVCEIIQQALDDGKPYDPELDPDADY